MTRFAKDSCDIGVGVDILNLSCIGIESLTVHGGDADAGLATLLDGTTLPRAEIDRLIPCFTPGAMIATPKGEVAVETLKVGDRVLTRDNGIQTITWRAEKRLDHIKLASVPELRPIIIKAGTLGQGTPEQDLVVSPMHRMLVVSEVAQLYFDQSEVLVPAKYLLAIDGVDLSEKPYVTYIHFMCENHEIVLSNGVWSESFQPSDYNVRGMDDDQRKELFDLFPDLATKEGVKQYRGARRSLERYEANLLFSNA